ncbi:MAG: DUF58 domain-containing protein [Victivallales bacterium]|jgi:uncharacterized protein (DUF58 family)|nr:DUF58 domain-containing protein [Victivallales bacterium]MBT7301839.1 DUF58 domain-containing protein [Victivallales bacterium]
MAKRRRNLFLRLRDRFYLGPTFMGIDSRTEKRRGYKSPTVLGVRWLYAFGSRHLTTAGLLLILCSGLTLLYAMFSLLMPIHLLAFTMVGIVVVDIVAGLPLAPRARARRDLPTRMACGSEHTIRYTLHNDSLFTARDIHLDALPYPRGLELPQGRAILATVPPGETGVASATIQAGRRGRYHLPAMRADSAFPFQLWRWGREGEGARALTVYPAFTPLTAIDMPSGMRYQAGGIALSSQVGQSMEFLGCRQFRQGDDMRRLHWRSWARVGYPVVREFREEYLCRTALIVDTARPAPYLWDELLRPMDLPLESVISLAAAVADYLADQDFVVDLFAAGPDVYRFRGGRSLGFLENILDILACVKPHYREPFAEFSDELVHEVAEISSAVFLLLKWNDRRRELVEAMSVAGVSVRVYLIVSTAGKEPADLPDHVIVLLADDVLSGKVIRL